MLVWLVSVALAVPPVAGGLDEGPPSVPELPEPTPILNGEGATLEDFASTGGIIAKGKAFGFDGRVLVCSSTLIAPDVVLTAAHCVDLEETVEQQYGITIEDFEIWWSRAEDLSDYAEKYVGDMPEDAVVAADWVWHEEWVGATGIRGPLWENHDIGLVFLAEPLEGVAPAVLPTADELGEIVQGAPVTIVGWGQTTSDQQPPPGTIGVKMWGDSHIEELGESEMQIGEAPEDVRKCHGDSGGPTFLAVTSDSTEPYRQVGITSHSYDETDCRETGGVDTRVDFYLDWIDAQMRQACDDGVRTACDDPGILPPPLPEEGAKACGCGTGGGAGWVAVFAGALLLRRRRG